MVDTPVSNPIQVKMGADTLAQVLNGLGAIGLYRLIIDSDLIGGLGGIIAIGIALAVLYFRNRWNEARKNPEIDQAVKTIEKVAADNPELVAELKKAVEKKIVRTIKKVEPKPPEG